MDILRLGRSATAVECIAATWYAFAPTGGHGESKLSAQLTVALLGLTLKSKNEKNQEVSSADELKRWAGGDGKHHQAWMGCCELRSMQSRPCRPVLTETTLEGNDGKE